MPKYGLFKKSRKKQTNSVVSTSKFYISIANHSGRSRESIALHYPSIPKLFIGSWNFLSSRTFCVVSTKLYILTWICIVRMKFTETMSNFHQIVTHPVLRIEWPTNSDCCSSRQDKPILLKHYYYYWLKTFASARFGQSKILCTMFGDPHSRITDVDLRLGWDLSYKLHLTLVQLRLLS